MKKTLLLTFFACLAAVLSAQTTKNIPERHPVLGEDAIIANIEATVGQVMHDWKIPCMGVALYKDGRTVLCKGYGVKNLDTGVPADAHTLFQIGSVSKSFTAAVIAQLVDEGLLKWEDRVKDHLPDFQMYDPWVTEHIEIQDLTSHRTGLRDDIGTYLGNLGYNRDDIYRMLRLMPPAYTFRGDYQYNNITFIPAAKVIEKVTGKSWEDNVRERIFKPLGMTESTLNGEGFGAALEAGTAALPYAFERKGREMDVWPMIGDEQSLWWLTVVGPAGSVCCTPTDLIKWARFHLDNGKVGDTQLISEKQMRFLHRGVTITSQTPDKTNLYGHCWFIEQTRKCRMYFHTGTTWGMTTMCCFIPEMDFAMTIQVNSEAPSEARHAILRRAIDLYLGYEDYDYNAEYVAAWYKRADERAKADEKAAAERVAVEAPAWSRLQGRYYGQHDVLGDIDVLIEDGRLMIQLHNEKAWKRELRHVNGNVFNFRADGWGFDVTFHFDKPDEWGSLADGLSITVGSGEEFANWYRASVPVVPDGKRPVIGVSAYTENGYCEVNMTYVNAIRQAGGIPLVIPVTSDDAQLETVLASVDGLVMTGGEDNDPLKWYGEEPVRGLGEVVPERDEFDVKLVRAAVAKGIPVLGICRGEQLLAVAFGGALWQDIPSQVKDSFVKHRQGPTTGRVGTHTIAIDPDSQLSRILGGRTGARVNSFHHQAVKTVPDGLRVSATAADGIIEAVERAGRLAPDYADGGAFLLGVQFHPEAITAGGNPEFLPLFRKLVQEATN